MLAFKATYDEEGAAQAERAFYVRSVLELRRLSTFGPPLGFAIIVAAAVVLEAPPWFILGFSMFFVLSVAAPVFFYFARPRAARISARQYPVRDVGLTHDAVEMSVGDQKAVIAWNRIRYVWDTDTYVILVLGKFGSVSIPRRSLPEGAYEFIRASLKNGA